jgi:hypothetical protein
MSYLHDEDWVFIDDYHRDTQELKNEIEDLQFRLESYQSDEVFMLSELMLLRDRMVSDGVTGSSFDHLTQLLGFFPESVRERAAGLLIGMEA